MKQSANDHKIRETATLGRRVRGKDALPTVEIDPHLPIDRANRANRADTRRLAACLAACKGISTESLEENGVASADSLHFMVRKLAAVTQQRDILVEALQTVMRHGNSVDPPSTMNLQQ